VVERGGRVGRFIAATRQRRNQIAGAGLGIGH
jgi:hypothetical protein